MGQAPPEILQVCWVPDHRSNANSALKQGQMKCLLHRSCGSSGYTVLSSAKWAIALCLTTKCIYLNYRYFIVKNANHHLSS